ncbi:class I SAM-dependent methyltransferase [bacterium]|nr:class I SAM-dependent methyltransferase [bacterium]
MSVFQDLYANAYDELYRDKDYGVECSLIVKVIESGVFDVNAILDVGCGTGGHLIPLAQQGYCLTGIDPSASMVDLALRKSEESGVRGSIDLINSSAAEFSCSKKHDFAIMMFAVIGYHASNAEVIACLKNIKAHLRSGASLVFDFWYGPAVLHDEPSDRVKVIEMAGEKIIRITKTVMDSFTHTADVTFETIRIAQTKIVATVTETHKMRYFFPQEMAMFLEFTGFELRSMTAFPSLDEKLNKHSWNALCVATVV